MEGLDHATPGISLILVGALSLLLFSIRRAKRSKDSIYIRRIPGIDAIDEAIGRAAELGRPVSFCTGLTAVGPVLYACLGVLFYIAKRTAIYKSKFLIPQTAPEAMALVEETARDAYRSVGRAPLFDPQGIIYLSEDQFAFASGYMGLVHREKVGSAFLFGNFTAESLLLADAGQQVGAMQVAASVDPDQVPFFICTTDYTLIGEELFGASAYLSREPIQVGSLIAQDVLKLSFLTLMFGGVLLATIRSISPVLADNFVPGFFSTSWSSLMNWMGI